MEAAGIKDWSSHFVATTGQNDESVLFQMDRKFRADNQPGFFGMLPVPEGVGGRFSFASPVGLLPFAVTSATDMPHERIQEAMGGFAEAHRRFFDLPAADPNNTACRLARWWHLGEQLANKNDMVFC